MSARSQLKRSSAKPQQGSSVECGQHTNPTRAQFQWQFMMACYTPSPAHSCAGCAFDLGGLHSLFNEQEAPARILFHLSVTETPLKVTETPRSTMFCYVRLSCSAYRQMARDIRADGRAQARRSYSFTHPEACMQLLVCREYKATVAAYPGRTRT